ncbi:hypothetical protein SEA_TRIBUTE_259 [Streptomyces phage Tribute]|uniref:Uncharacterized protein n=1 Tax=Streptomyces phage Tribute TaxID=2653772 RepID=A0A5Q2WKY0_9CAUD|nr:hypothetical protein SEA_TRIBUTE_13 [Streptomyces phage Tribute]QGH78407.1 hypothetical protein SEA_TRIBUTE_259 [Streptomyces phage Tribute]
MTFEIPEGYSIISEEEYEEFVNRASESHQWVSAGVIRSGWLEDVWTVSEDDEPEYLVDCE